MDTLVPQVQRNLPYTLVSLRGALALPTVATVRTVLLKCLAECPPAVVVDLSELTVRDPLALAVFRAVQRRAADWPGVPLLLCAAPAAGTALLRQQRVHREVAVFATLAEAVEVATSGQPGPLRRVHASFRPTDLAPSRARALIRRVCADWGLPHLEQPAELILSELVSNAVLYAATEIDVTVALRPDHLHLIVRDHSPAPPRARSASGQHRAAEARGLRLVAAFATAWGSLPMEDGKSVWAMLRIAPANPAAG